MRFSRTVVAALALGAVLVASGCDAGPPPRGYTDPAGREGLGTPGSPDTATPGASVEPTPSVTPSPRRTRTPGGGESSGSTEPATPSGSSSDDSGSVPTTPAAPTSVPTFAATESDAPAAEGAPRSYRQAVARVSAQRGGSAQQRARFSTPQDRIYCVLGDDVLGTACELRSGGVRDTDVCAGTPGDRVGRLEMTRAGVIPQCNTDTIREPGAPTVAPDALVVGGGVSCAVESIGVTCIDERLRLGFFLAPGRYATFG